MKEKANTFESTPLQPTGQNLWNGPSTEHPQSQCIRRNQMVEGQSTDQLNPVKTQVSDHREQSHIRGSSSQQVPTCEVTPCKGLKQWPAWPPLAKRRQHSTFYTLRSCNPEPPGSIPFPSFQRSRRKEKLNTQTSTVITKNLMVWKKSFSTCCPRNRRSSMSLKSAQGSSQQISAPEQNLASGEREFGRTRHLVGRGARRHFLPAQEGHPHSARAIL